MPHKLKDARMSNNAEMILRRWETEALGIQDSRLAPLEIPTSQEPGNSDRPVQTEISSEMQAKSGRYILRWIVG